MTASSSPEKIVAELVQRSQTLAVAESLTGGLVMGELTRVPGASAAVRGGVVAYATDLKTRLLDVPAADLAIDGPVHPRTAAAMALGVRRRLAADWGLATTGVAGPDPQGGQPPGTLHLAVAGPDGLTGRSLTLSGDRAEVRRQAVRAALELLAAQLIRAGESGAAPRG